MHDQVERRCNSFESPQDAAEKRAELAAVGAGAGLFEKMVVAAVKNPDFKGNTGSIGTESVVVALNVHDAPAEFFFLADDVTKDAAFFYFVPVMSGGQLVFDAARDEDGSGDLRVGMSPFLASLRALILEDSDVFKSRVLFRSAIREPQTERTLSISSSPNCEKRLSCWGVSTMTS